MPVLEEPSTAETANTVLPLLASEAAIEFDCSLRGDDIGYEAARALGEFIKNDALNDFIAENLVFQALASSEWKPGVATVKEAEGESLVLAEALRNAETAPADQRQKLRDFCVAFSDKLVKHRQALRASLPSNPNRR